MKTIVDTDNQSTLATVPLPPSSYSPPLAPSPKVLAYLVRRGRIAASKMALATTDHGPLPASTSEPFTLPPPVAVTPCDPWPRPYYLQENLRRVQPYHYTYNTYCEARWRGREILEIFTDEFRDRPVEYYVSVPQERGEEMRYMLLDLPGGGAERSIHAGVVG